MKYIVLLLSLLAVAGAAAVSHDELLFLRKQLESLLTTVKAVDAHDSDGVYDVVDARKNHLMTYVRATPERNAEVRAEFEDLLHVVQRVDKGDFAGALVRLSERKTHLMGTYTSICGDSCHNLHHAQAK